MPLNCSTKVVKEVDERMAEKVFRCGSDFVSNAILMQIGMLEEMQETAIKRFDCKSVCELSEMIIAAAESYDRHINSGCDNSAAAAFDKVLYGKSEPVLPPSDKLLEVATVIYNFENIDGMSVDGILGRIRKAEKLEYWNRK